MHQFEKIPEGLFKNNINVISFRECFKGCSNLTEIPEGLFVNNTNATDFQGCFYGCSSLTEILRDYLRIMLM